LLFTTEKPNLWLKVCSLGVLMRDLIEKALKMGFTISFSEEGGFSIIRLLRGEQIVSNCSLGVGTFSEVVEETLQSMLLDAERRNL
jgi:hypothetical protein